MQPPAPREVKGGEALAGPPKTGHHLPCDPTTAIQAQGGQAGAEGGAPQQPQQLGLAHLR
jgi:hypothetical protein